MVHEMFKKVSKMSVNFDRFNICLNIIQGQVDRCYFCMIGSILFIVRFCMHTHLFKGQEQTNYEI